ncbi:aromatic-ring-hydroxylating dioxygenase subunit beta [Paeniglutamicibacter sp. MACA_103]|uniref:aromatic-ring-hydroxylating dioxygenase subunit beta n=1 Tax=Paeniglutamicibacter sp. MACA_103 TaxID=3377337 RepID=UPI0038942D15
MTSESTLTAPLENGFASDALLDPLVSKAIALIWHEATLLDAKDYVSWEGLWTPAGKYVIPIDPDTDDFESGLNMVYDDARMRRMRVTRLTEGYSMSAVASARTARTISRFTVTANDGESVTLRSAQIIVGFKREKHLLLAADLEHRISFVDGEPRLDLKVVRLVNSDGAVTASGFLL